MDLIVERVDVWAAGMKDQPGTLARLLTGLREAGADLDFIVVRRAEHKPGTGVVFVTPLRGDTEIDAAANLGFSATSSLHVVRVEGQNKPGIAAQITQKIAAEGINLRGMTAAVIGTKFILYLGLDMVADAEKTVKVLKKA